MKKIIAMILLGIFILVMSNPSVINAKADRQEKAVDYYSFLKAIGVMANDESFSGNEKITRAKFVSMALGLRRPNVYMHSKDYKTSFTDIDPMHPYYEFVATAENIGIISSNPQGKFRPDDEITKNEAAKIICCLLDYTDLAEMSGGYPSGYNKIAVKTGFYKGLSTSDDGLTGNDAVRLITNAVKSDVLTMVSVDADGNITYDIQRDKTVLSEKLHIRTVKGILAADCCTDIYAADPGLEKGYVLINNTVFDAGDSSIRDYIGYNLETYYDDEDNIPKIVYFELLNNNVVTADYESAEFMTNCIKYEDENERQKEAKVDSRASYLLNGKLAGQNQIAKENCKNGKITLIDNNGDNKADVVSVYNYTTHIVTNVDLINRSVYTEDGITIELKDDEKDYIYFIKKNDKYVSLDSVKRDDVILLAESKLSGINMKQILLSDNVVEGSVYEKSENKVTADGDEYKADGEMLSNIDVGAYYIFKVDYFGKIADMKKIRDFVYGYLYRIENKGIDKFKCKIFTEYNRWVTLDCDENIEFNEKKNVRRSSVFEQIAQRENGYNEIIRYKVNNDGKIKMINFAEDMSGYDLLSDYVQSACENDIFRKSFDGTIVWRMHSNSFDGKIRLNDDTKIFYIPTNDTFEESKIISASRLSANDDVRFTAYDIDENLYARILTVDEMAVKSIGSGSPFMIVRKVTRGVNSFGDDVPVLEGYWNGNYIKVPAVIDTVLPEEDLVSLKKNDIILFNMDDNGNVQRISKCKSDENGYYGNAYHTSECMAGGRIVKRDTENESFVIQNGSSTYYIAPYDSKTKVVLYNSEEDECIVTDPGSLVVGDTIIAKLRYYSLLEVIVIR